MDNHTKFDLICIGSGIAGCAAALAGAEKGLSVCVLEKSSRLGGGSAYSTGGLWIGANHHQAEHNLSDSLEETQSYMEFVSGGAAIPENLNAFVKKSPEALKAFEKMGLRFEIRPTVPDHYYPHGPNSKPGGRSFGAAPVTREELGNWFNLIEENPYFPPGVSNSEIADWGGLGNMRNWDAKTLRERSKFGTLGVGQAVVGQFLLGLLKRNVSIYTDFNVTSLSTRDGRVTGVNGSHSGQSKKIQANLGVVKATGGYEGNPELVDRFEGIPGWRSMFPPGVTGDGMVMATEIGAAVYRVPENFFFFLGYEIPADKIEKKPRFRMTGFSELSYPHTIVVNREGHRFFDESSFQKGVRPLKNFDPGTHSFPNLPCFMIFDRQFLELYSFAGRPPGAAPPKWLRRGESVEDLARILEIDSTTLKNTIARFNQSATKGTDPEFGRGQFLWIKAVSGDASHPVHPNLAPLNTPPYFGVQLHPSGSSSAGLLTDKNARVVHVRGNPINGLYACGNAAATADFGVGYQAGFLLTRGMTFGYLAAQHAANTSKVRF